MTWLPVALSAYFLLAFANLLDKFLVDNVLKSSKAYAFVVCVIGLFVFAVAPWFLEWPGVGFFFFNIVTGFLFAIALWYLYEALKWGEAAKTLVFIGGLTPVFTIVLSIIFFKQTFTLEQWLGMFFLLLGLVVIILLPKKKNLFHRFFPRLKFNSKFGKNSLKIALISALFYSLFFVASKYAYNHQPFVSAFLWNRLGAGLFVLLFLIRKKDRRAISSLFKKSTPNKNKGLVVFNQVLGSSGFVLQNFAVSLGPVALVNALQGFQYAFLLVISAIMAAVAPKLLKDGFSWRSLIQKTIAVLLVGLGLYFIV